ncbi:titin homolog [Helicoverpa armigera]|uniref:titin homolog n=1 Tax=Helicoverpa armigera TaxID=29058 RepID=UPI003083E2CD
MVRRILLVYTFSTLITEQTAEASEIKISFGKKNSDNHTIAFKTRDIADKEYRKHIQYHPPTAILEESLTTPKSRKDTFNFQKNEDGKKKHHHKYKKVKNGKKINKLLSDDESYKTHKNKGKNNNIVSDVNEKETYKDSEDASEPLVETLSLPTNVEKLNAKVPKKVSSKKNKIKKADVKSTVKHKHILRVKHRDAKQSKKAKNTKPSKITGIDNIIESKESITGDNDSLEMDSTPPSNMEKLKAAVHKKKDKTKKDIKPKIEKQKNILRIKHSDTKQTIISKYTKPLKVTVIDNIIDSKESVSRDIEQTINRNTQSDEKTVEITLPKKVNDNRKDFEKEKTDYPVIHEDYDNIKPYGQSDSTNEENSDHSISEDNELYKLKIQDEEIITTTTVITTEKSQKIRVSRKEGPFEKIGRNKHYFYELKPKNNKKHGTNALRMKIQHPKRLGHSSKHLHKKNKLHKHGKSDLKSKTVKIKKGKFSNGKVDFEKGVSNIVRQGPNVDSEEVSSSKDESKIQEKVNVDSNEALLEQNDKGKAKNAATENVRDTSFTKKPRKMHKKTTAKDVTTENSAIDNFKKILQDPLESNEIDLNATLDRFASSKLFDIFTERLANQMLLKMQRRLGDSNVNNLARRTEIEPDTVERIEISITNDGDMVINQDLKKDGTNESMLYVNPNLRSTAPLRLKMQNYRY